MHEKEILEKESEKNEDLFSKKIISVLDSGLILNEDISKRLEFARTKALENFKIKTNTNKLSKNNSYLDIFKIFKSLFSVNGLVVASMLFFIGVGTLSQLDDDGDLVSTNDNMVLANYNANTDNFDFDIDDDNNFLEQ